MRRATLIVAAALGGLLIGARRASCKLRPVPFQQDDSPGDHAARIDYSVESLTELFGDSDTAKVVHWRIEELKRNGFTDLLAATIGSTLDADWRKAIELVRSGCSQRVAADIVL